MKSELSIKRQLNSLQRMFKDHKPEQVEWEGLRALQQSLSWARGELVMSPKNYAKKFYSKKPAKKGR